MNEFGYGVPRRAILMAGLAGLAAPANVGAADRVLRIGANQPVKTLAAAARLARDGMTVEVAAGDYIGDVADWPQNDLTLRAVGGRVRMIAAGASSQGKGIFVTRGERLRIEGFDFVGCRVPDGNGAGIRLERGSLSLLDCGFRDNEMGLLTGNDGQSRLTVENCEFGPVLNFRGYTHNLYVGRIAQLTASGCYFHHGRVGHLLKSRAAINEVLYSRLTDGPGGNASYELEFPNGGRCRVIGNMIGQSETTGNPVIVSFGAEGLVGPDHELALAHNTLIDGLRGAGRPLRVSGDGVRVQLVGNLLIGAGDDAWARGGNHVVEPDAFVDAARGDWRLRPDSPLRGQAVDPGEGLRPLRQYVHPHGSVALRGPARDPGAFQAA